MLIQGVQRQFIFKVPDCLGEFAALFVNQPQMIVHIGRGRIDCQRAFIGAYRTLLLLGASQF